MSECACSVESCDCPTVQDLREEVDQLKSALEQVASFRGPRRGIHYGRDGMSEIRRIAIEALQG